MQTNNSILKNIKISAVAIVFLLLLAFAYWYNSHSQISHLTINIQPANYGFVSEKDVHDYLVKGGAMYNNTIPKESIHQLEFELRKHNYIDSVVAYLTKSDELQLDIIQMTPIARVFLDGKQSFYLKKNNKLIPPSTQYTARVPIVTGFAKVVKDSDFRADFVTLMTFIQSDSFLNAQIQQVDIVASDDIILYPTLGNERIKFGKIENVNEKFDNLKEFYKQVLSKQGFSTYQIIDIRFANQVVASPTLNKYLSTKI